MAHLTHIARPYARAAFMCAEEGAQVKEWKRFLEAASVMLKEKSVLSLLDNPKCSSEQLLRLFENVLTSVINHSQKQFLKILVQAKRLIALPDILALFITYEAQAEKQSIVRVVTALPIKEAFKERLTAALKKRLQRQICLQHEIDPSILGGAVIHMGDRVVDGSLRGELSRLLAFSLA